MKNKRFEEAVEKQRNRVLELLQLWGDMPDVTMGNAIAEDWLHALMSAVTDVSEETRKLSGEDCEEARRILRKRLATVAAVCKAWEKRV